MGDPRRPPFEAILLAGGSGTRFWPMSRARGPKQFLPLAGGDPLLLSTWKRVRRLAPPRRMWVVAPKALASAVRVMLPGLREDRLIVEPEPRDTAPAIGLACAVLERRNPAATVAVFPTDHVIRDQRAFGSSIGAAVRAAGAGALVCLGVRPDRPATGYGYLKCDRLPRRLAAVPVEKFVEKPDEKRARRYVRSGRYLWNAGMFVWKIDRFMEELGRASPVTLEAVRAVASGRRRAWASAERMSVDHGVMEKARGVRVVPLRAGWDDVGSWAAAARLKERSGTKGRAHVLIDSDDSLVFAEDRLVALVDVPDVVVVDAPDALLVVRRDRCERVREVVQALKRSKRKGLL